MKPKAISPICRWKCSSVSSPSAREMPRNFAVSANWSASIAKPTNPSPTASSTRKPRPGCGCPIAATARGAPASTR
jgi:hypothetical protein